jgi:eukaryotic-like serine/threonine-protein kinase
VHRDIKPANLYLARRDGGEIIVKILDFGIAKVKLDHLGSSENQQLTRTGSVLGSPRYMSPEQAKGLRTIDHRTDIWSLGAVLYQALTGRTPHHDKDTLGQLIIAICSEAPAPVQDYASWVSPELAAVVSGTLTMDVAQRVPSAPALLEALRALQPAGFALHESMLAPLAPATRTVVMPRLDRGGVTASGDRTAHPAVTAGGLSGTQQSLARTTGEATRSSAALWLAAGAVLLTGAGGAGYWALSQRQAVGEPSAATASAPVTPEIAPSATAAPASATSAPTPAERAVRLGVGPAGVGAEVDGKAVEVKDGAVELRGALGSTHKVLLRLGGLQLSRDVAITENGALPDRLEFVAPRVARGASPSKPATAAAAPAAAPAAAAPAAAAKPAVVTKPAATSKPSGLDRNFE